MSFKNGLAISYWKLGDFKRKTGDKAAARVHFEAVEAFCVALVTDFPAYPQFRRQLEAVRKDLEGLDVKSQ